MNLIFFCGTQSAGFAVTPYGYTAVGRRSQRRLYCIVAMRHPINTIDLVSSPCHTLIWERDQLSRPTHTRRLVHNYGRRWRENKQAKISSEFMREPIQKVYSVHFSSSSSCSAVRPNRKNRVSSPQRTPRHVTRTPLQTC